MSFFRVDSVTAGYGKTDVIENLSFCMEKGSMVGILGANGSGKDYIVMRKEDTL
jgi:ABC-type cobalamin/Fe3+-siderophores transport system ATPase subunit